MKVQTLTLCVMAIVAVAVLSGCGPTMNTKYDLASTQDKNKEYAKAIDSYKAYIAEFPNDMLVPYAWYHIGMDYKALNQTDMAKDAFKKVMEQFPQTEPYNWANAELKNIDKAAAQPK